VNEQTLPVGIFAASSVVPQVEFRGGVEHLRVNGFDPRVQPQVSGPQDFIFPGSDEERAETLHRLATDPSLKILWAARGGYGAARLLPLLDRLTRERGAPPRGKLLVGYSDVTVLHEFVRTRWGWSTLHAAMPAEAKFPSLAPAEWTALDAYVRGADAPDVPWAHSPLRWITAPPPAPIHAELVGGNLSLWIALCGTPYATPGAGRIIFLEDVGEAFYRIDRMVVQLEQSGALANAAAVVLGDFTGCNDENNQCLADPQTGEKKPLRQTFQQPEAFAHIFGRLGIPVAQGLPVGHGPRNSPLPLGARYELAPNGRLQLLEWDWLAP
jgi:muramoyltetrapeptide carboxypeptidase